MKITGASFYPPIAAYGTIRKPQVKTTPRFGEINFRSDTMDIPALEFPPHPSRTMITIGRHLTRLNLWFNEGIRRIEVQGADKVRALLKEGKHVILALNHPGFGDVYLTPKISQIAGKPCATIGQIGLFYAIKSPTILKATVQPVLNWTFSRIGIFPVHGDIKDNGAQKTAIDVVEQGKYPFIIFPEGHYTWQNDKISELQYGTASIGLKAAAKLKEKHETSKQPFKEVIIVPIGIKHRFLGDVLPTLSETLSKLEKQVGLSPSSNTSPRQLEDIVPRVEALWLKVLNDMEATLLKEEEKIQAPPAQTLATRHHQVTENLIRSVEKALNITPQPDESYAQRIKNARKYYRLLRGIPNALSDNDKKQFDAIYKPRLIKAWEFQKFSTDYLREKVTPERIAETLFKLDYILTNKESDMMAQIGSRKTVLKVGDPILLTPELAAFQADPRATVAKVTHTLRNTMQHLIDSI